MKNTIKSFLAIAFIAAIGMSQANAAVTLSFATQTGSANGPNGLPVVDSSGAAILNSTNSLFASIGYLSVGADTTAAGYLARFNPIDNVPIIPNLLSAGNPRNGLFNSQDYNSTTNAYPTASIVGGTTAAYVLIGNNSTLANSTAIALFAVGNFGVIDAINGLNQSFILTSASVPVIGTVRSVTTEPISGNTFANGVSLVPVAAVPEPSAALLGMLGALGLFRRRR
jgi:hypothetical protein